MILDRHLPLNTEQDHRHGVSARLLETSQTGHVIHLPEQVIVATEVQHLQLHLLGLVVIVSAQTIDLLRRDHLVITASLRSHLQQGLPQHLQPPCLCQRTIEEPHRRALHYSQPLHVREVPHQDVSMDLSEIFQPDPETFLDRLEDQIPHIAHHPP